MSLGFYAKQVRGGHEKPLSLNKLCKQQPYKNLADLRRHLEGVINRFNRINHWLQVPLINKNHYIHIKHLVRWSITANPPPIITKRVHNDHPPTITLPNLNPFHGIPLPNPPQLKIIHPNLPSPPMVFTLLPHQRYLRFLIPFQM